MKKVGVHVDFLHSDNIKDFFKLILLLLVGVASHAQSTQNNKFKITISQQYLKKEMKDKFDFLHEDKHQSFQQADIIVFGGHSQAWPKYPR